MSGVGDDSARNKLPGNLAGKWDICRDYEMNHRHIDISIKMDRLDPTTFLLQHSSRPRQKLKRNGIDASGFGAESMNASTPGPKRR